MTPTFALACQLILSDISRLIGTFSTVSVDFVNAEYLPHGVDRCQCTFGVLRNNTASFSRPSWIMRCSRLCWSDLPANVFICRSSGGQPLVRAFSTDSTAKRPSPHLRSWRQSIRSTNTSKVSLRRRRQNTQRRTYLRVRRQKAEIVRLTRSVYINFPPDLCVTPLFHNQIRMA